MRRKSLLFQLSALVVLVMLMVSCSKKAEEYTNVIPADASVVVSLDLQSLIKKSGVEDNEIAKQKLTDVMKSGLNADVLQYIEKIIKDPAESGVSISDKVYIFTSNPDKGGAFAAKVLSMDKVKEGFKLMENEKACEPLTEVNGYSQTVINGEAVCAFNENTLLIVGGQDIETVKKNVAELMSQSADKSINSNKGFTELNSEKNDLSAFVTMDILPAQYKMMATPNLPEGSSLKDMCGLISLNFEKGKVVAKVKSFTTNEAILKMNKEYATVFSKLGEGFMECFPVNSLYYAGMNMDGEKLMEMLSQNKNFKPMLEQASRSGVDVVKILSSIKGNLAYGVTSVSMQGMPDVLVYAEVVNDEILKAINGAFGPMAKKQEENRYSISLGNGMDMYYGMDGKTFYFTMNAEAAKNVGKKVDNPMTDAKWASTAKNSLVFLVMNVKDALNLPIVNMALGMGGQQAMMAKTIFSKFDYIEMSATNNQEMLFDVVMIDQNENALKQFVALGEQVAGGE